MGRWKEIAWTKAEIETLREVWPRESRRVILVMVCLCWEGKCVKNQETET